MLFYYLPCCTITSMVLWRAVLCLSPQQLSAPMVEKIREKHISWCQTLEGAQLALIFRAALTQISAVGLWSSSAGKQMVCRAASPFQSTRKLEDSWSRRILILLPPPLLSWQLFCWSYLMLFFRFICSCLHMRTWRFPCQSAVPRTRGG